jgi:hypothetical protein
MKDHKKIRKIDDPRIAEYTQRTRSGTTQEFYTGTDARDWDRNRADRKAGAKNPEMHLKADTIHIQPPEKHWYSELIEGEWWWLNGCAECNGNRRDWMTYIECTEHNVCRSCRTPRAEIKDIPWGGKRGWNCQPCQRKLEAATKYEALAKMEDKPYCEWDYHGTDEVICPHCDTNQNHEMCDGEPSEKSSCETCGGDFSVTLNYSVTFDTNLIGERVVNEEAD